MPRTSRAHTDRGPASARRPWKVSSRKGAAQWADSVLPPSPRVAMLQEVGHKTSADRKPVVSAAAAMGALAKPAPFTMTSDRVNSPRDWMVYRASVLGKTELPGQKPSRFSGSARTSPLSSREKLLAKYELDAKNRERERNWDPLPFRVCPPRYLGIKPHTGEPWADDAYTWHHAKTTRYLDEFYVDEDEVDAARLGYMDYYARGAASYHPDNESSYRYRPAGYQQGYEQQQGAGGYGQGHEQEHEQHGGYAPDEYAPDGYAAEEYYGDDQYSQAYGRQRQPWDPSPMRHTPHVLRGIKPVTAEPWAMDEAIYNEDTLRDTTDEERSGGGDLDLGSTSHAERARLRQVDRPGFYLPNWEQWSASLSA